MHHPAFSRQWGGTCDLRPAPAEPKRFESRLMILGPGVPTRWEARQARSTTTTGLCMRTASSLAAMMSPSRCAASLPLSTAANELWALTARRRQRQRQRPVVESICSTQVSAQHQTTHLGISSSFFFRLEQVTHIMTCLEHSRQALSSSWAKKARP
jgi:hypothetical protein